VSCPMCGDPIAVMRGRHRILFEDLRRSLGVLIDRPRFLHDIIRLCSRSIINRDMVTLMLIAGQCKHGKLSWLC
jgi:hypothetical protein